MPFSRPALTTIRDRVKTDIQTALSATAAFFKRSFERGVAAALTGASHLLHGHLDWIAAQMDPSTADEDQLSRIHGAPYGIVQKQAVAVQLRLTATGTSGTVVPVGQTFLRADNVSYTLDANSTVVGGSVTMDVTAETADEASNCDVGTALSLESPVAGLNDDAVVSEVLTVGSDKETRDDYEARIYEERSNPIRGGANGDYERWALQVAGVTRAWEYPRRDGPGTVTLYAVNDDGVSSIALDASKITEIETYLDQPGRQPSTVDVYVYTPTLYAVNITASITPSMSTVQDAAEAELAAAITNAGNPGGMTVLLSVLNEAISIAPGETDHTITSPASDLVIPFGSIPVLGTVTWS